MKQLHVTSFFILAIHQIQGRSLLSDQNGTFLDDLNEFSDSPYIRHKEPYHQKGDRYFQNSLFDMNPQYCRRNAKCQPLLQSKCMGAKLPYHSTTLDLTDLSNQTKVQEKLQMCEQYLKFIPKCWAVIQPFLCALYMPKCDNGEVDLPSREMCKITLEPCKIIYNMSTVFPEFFDCKNERLFPSKCRNDIHEMKFNITGYYMEPLIETDKPDWWFSDIEGCGLQCKDSKYTDNEQYQIHKLITYGALLCIILNIFTVTTFLIDWKTGNRYPTKGIFYVNICFAISYGGYLVQFLGTDTREDVVCKKDGTLRKSEPSATENLSCVIVFFMVYYFLIAGLVWFMIFSYGMVHEFFTSLSQIVKMTVFTIFMAVFCIVTIGYHVYVASNRHLWDHSLEKYILCKLTSFSTNYSHCKQTNRPSVAMLQLHLLAVFGMGIAMASWVWCDATLHAWGRYIRKKFHCEVEEPIKVQKHRIIVRAFAGRKLFNEDGRISIFSQNHTDPVGLQFELNSAASNDLSTAFAKNLPRLVNRRPAIPNDVVAESYNPSLDSDYSVNYRHVRIESRRNSSDSQVSVQIAELKATKRVKGRRTRRTDNHNFRRHSRNIGTSSRCPSRTGTKRGSSTSLDSHFQLLNVLTNEGGGDLKTLFAPNLNRRTATAGLDGAPIGQLLSNGKLILPPNNFTGSEDENVSVTISETAVNMRVANQNLDLNDHFTICQLRRGLRIVQVSSSESEREKDRSSNERESRSSKKTKKSFRRKYSSDSESCEKTHHYQNNRKTSSDSSSCAEIKQLVQSSLNSAVSVGFEKNRGSRQSKTSMDVAVQANAHDLDLEMNNKKIEEEMKSSKSKRETTNILKGQQNTEVT
ncbi:hypothetical protein ABEB36_002952 [Hypothenemus hampei]|uniref:FZ domain-containing protein n=1 Tax=Hypothenemus hampei TaxID=57062 RepID=A0ABD1F7X0_HYPHA